MKPKWKPHDDPACRCAGCKPQGAVDETRGIAMPQGVSEWRAFCDAAGLSQWMFWGYEESDASSDSSMLVVDGVVKYQQRVIGWNRAHIKLKDKT